MGAPATFLESGAAVIHLDDWVLSMHGARRTRSVIEERRRTVTRLGNGLGIQPCLAQPLEIAEWMASHNDTWSDNTAGTYYGHLKAWFLWLQVSDHRLDNPMLKVGRPRTPDREPRPVSDASLVRLLCTPMYHRTRVMILLAALAGLRVSEIAAVRGEHVDVTVPSIWVEGKNLKGRTLPLHPLLVDVAATMPKHGIWFPANANRPGLPVLGKSVSHTVSLVMRRAEVTGTPHSLRHWYGSTLLADGADLRVVQELLRHSSLNTTQIYTKIPDRRRHDAIKRLDPFRATRGLPGVEVQ